ncbi:MAG: hypothetical protein P0Y49_19000 [Candidatus Pedobacter colombiensis]|uniref:Uncharacterized protein n=1 Tax=Candidatus Pedobacter colombiensis TaxID=3121371 RepID=A0AAJ5W9M3_9SPHI|nr:hypothetical protein [Pedobacter sp.]WEK18867.1 MAG: hypothetical protein P0Y49_19000 [Pedobacter sp.]
MPTEKKARRVVVIYWRKQHEIEVFSNLKNFCLSYPQYNYNTLSNYLSKDKTAYENNDVRVERKEIISKPKESSVVNRKIAPLIRKVRMKEANDSERDLNYWLSRPASERVGAVSFLVRQMLKKGERMDKTIVKKIRPKQ